ncbi:UPF0058 family protein [Halodesulfurarchaeum sp. HSR-GB]|nr:MULTISPECIES: UPF0058 family protein [Halodesulfurarchaeum]MDR5655596.1 UPF0058 family protein [Halodesulfurarchaeum sp. HSR-GB]
MKKQELIHLHGLLAEVGNYYERVSTRELELSEYESKGVRPTSIHKSKTDHKSAVFALAKGITGTMDEAESAEETVTAKAD